MCDELAWLSRFYSIKSARRSSVSALSFWSQRDLLSSVSDVRQCFNSARSKQLFLLNYWSPYHHLLAFVLTSLRLAEVRVVSSPLTESFFFCEPPLLPPGRIIAGALFATARCPLP